MAKDFYTLDAETDPAKKGRCYLKAFLWGVYNGKTGQYWKFKTVEEVVEFISKIGGIFYAHNGGKFDFHYLAPWITQNEKILMINSRLVKGKIGRAEIRDSFALLPFKLSDYKKDEIDYSIFEEAERIKPENMALIESYLMGDCVYLWDLLDAFFNDFGRHLTAPGAAIKTLCKMEGIKIENTGKYFYSEFKPHYSGGHCECLNPGSFKGPLTCLDINSAYPFAMLHQHPIGSDFEFAYHDNPPIIPWAFYVIKAKSFGALARRTRDKLVFDRDGETRIYNTTGWEIKAGLETNTLFIEQHIKQKFFKETKDFSTFINYFYDLRKTYKKGTPENLFAKLMMNSAYGKFAANPDNYETFVLYDPSIAAYLISEDWDIRGEFGDSIICSKPMDESEMRFYNVATGASITGFVRAMLHRAICATENPIYCDTDSLIFSGNHSLELGDELGQWKVEGIYDEGHFAGKKLYAMKNKQEEKLASKGSKLTFKEIKKITQGHTIEYTQEFPTYSWFKNPSVTTRNIRRTA